MEEVKEGGEMTEKAFINTDKELWREVEGDYYSPSIHVTNDGLIGVNVNGEVFVKPVQEWHGLAVKVEELQKQNRMWLEENQRLLQDKVKYKGAFEALYEKVKK